MAFEMNRASEAIKAIAKQFEEDAAEAGKPLEAATWEPIPGGGVRIRTVDAEYKDYSKSDIRRAEERLAESRYEGPTKRLVVIKGKGTPNERRIETDITLYWSKALGRYVTIPE